MSAAVLELLASEDQPLLIWGIPSLSYLGGGEGSACYHASQSHQAIEQTKHQYRHQDLEPGIIREYYFQSRKLAHNAGCGEAEKEKK